MSLIEKKLNDEVWIETLVLEEAERVQRPDPLEKNTTRKPDKINQLQKTVCIYQLIGWVSWRVYWRVHVHDFTKLNFRLI